MFFLKPAFVTFLSTMNQRNWFKRVNGEATFLCNNHRNTLVGNTSPLLKSIQGQTIKKKRKKMNMYSTLINSWNTGFLADTPVCLLICCVCVCVPSLGQNVAPALWRSSPAPWDRATYTCGVSFCRSVRSLVTPFLVSFIISSGLVLSIPNHMRTVLCRWA